MLFFSSVTFSQKIKNVKTLDIAVETAALKQKSILLIIHNSIIKGELINPPKYPLFRRVGINSEDLTDRINESFICYSTYSADTMLKTLIPPLLAKSFPIYLFIRPNKDIYYKSFGYPNNKAEYMKMLDDAQLAYKNQSLTELKNAHLSSPTDNHILKSLIDTRKKLGYFDNAGYIDKFVDNLNVNELNDFKTVLYILEAGPYSDSKALKLAYLNKTVADNINNLSEIKRAEINKLIITNSINNAVSEKSLPKAQSTATFAKLSWANDYQKARQAYDSQMLNFYDLTRDTLNYFKSAIRHYDTYYMDNKIDSTKRLFSTKNNDTLGISITSDSSSLNSKSGALAIAAIKFYLSGTKNAKNLVKAVQWCKKAIEIKPLGTYYNTLALLQYRLGDYDQAIDSIEIAINLLKRKGLNTHTLKYQLAKMKEKTF